MMNLQQAAERLGVHYQTAYRWVRDGELTAVKHKNSYQVDEAEVERFKNRRLVPATPPERMHVRSWAPHRERLLEALLSGEELEARAVIDRLVDGHVSVVELCEELIAPCLAEVGDRWHKGGVSVAEEHRATAICERILGRIATHPRGRPRGCAVVISAPNDDHALPSTMAALALRDDTWRVHHLGANVPTEDILPLAQKVQADLVVLSVTYAHSHEANLLAADLRASGLRVLIGGQDGKTLTDLVTAAREG